MPGAMRPENRRWEFFYLAGMPAEICGGHEHLTAEQAAQKIMEEWPGQRRAFLSMAKTHAARSGAYFDGRRFIIICVE